MRPRLMSTAISIGLLCALAGFGPESAAGRAGSGPRERVNQRFTTTAPGSPTGISFTGTFHGAGDRKSPPPYLRRIVFDPPGSMRYDTSVPDHCTATDAELQLMGPAACPPGSRLGGGTIEGLIQVPFAHQITFDHFKHPVDILNNADEQIILVESEGSTVVRGEIRPDGSVVFTPKACFPVIPVVSCLDDYVVQLKSVTKVPPYTRVSNGRVRSYATTPATCPASGFWLTKLRLRWSDGSAETVASRQPCKPR